MIKGVIFDMDGVLVDNRDAHIEAFEIICRKYGVPFDREKFMPSFGMTNDLILERLMPEVIRRTDWRQIAREKEETYREIFERTIAPTRGLVDFLRALKADGFLVGLGSSGNTPNVNFVLERCGIAKYFDAIANGDMISRGPTRRCTCSPPASWVSLRPSASWPRMPRSASRRPAGPACP